MQTAVDPNALGVAARTLSEVSAELSEARRALAATQAMAGGDLGKAASYAAADTWRASDRALDAMAGGISELADALRELTWTYEQVDNAAIGSGVRR